MNDGGLLAGETRARRLSSASGTKLLHSQPRPLFPICLQYPGRTHEMGPCRTNRCRLTGAGIAAFGGLESPQPAPLLNLVARRHKTDETRVYEHDRISPPKRSRDSQSPNYRDDRGTDENLQFLTRKLVRTTEPLPFCLGI